MRHELEEQQAELAEAATVTTAQAQVCPGSCRRQLRYGAGAWGQAAHFILVSLQVNDLTLLFPKQDQINQLIAEREAWIEEVQSQRTEASGAGDGSEGLQPGLIIRPRGRRRSRSQHPSPAIAPLLPRSLSAAAIERCRALERGFAELAEEKSQLAEALEGVQVGAGPAGCGRRAHAKQQRWGVPALAMRMAC